MPSRKLIISFKLGREKNIFVKFVFLCVLSKVEKFATKDRLLINQSHHHTIPPIGNLINPFSNHHTIIILKSHNLRTYVLRPQCVTVRSPRLALRLSLSPNKTVSHLPIVEAQLFFHLGLMFFFLTFLCT